MADPRARPGSANAASPGSATIDIGSRKAPSRRNSPSRRSVASLASATLGWSKGFTPRTIPAAAVATSQRKNSVPTSSPAREVVLHHRVPRRSQVRGQADEFVIGFAFEGRDHEAAVVAVLLGRPERLPHDRDHAAPQLAGALRHQLLDPVPQGRQAHAGQDGQLVPPRKRCFPDRCPQDEPRVVRRRPPAGVGHGAGTGQQRLDVHAPDRRRDETEDRQRRVAAADARLALHDGAELLGAGQLAQRGARIGDRDEVERGYRLGQAGVEGVGLGRGARLGRHAQDGPGGGGPAPEPAHRVRMGGIAHAQGGHPLEQAPAQLRSEARAAHPQHGGAPVPVARDAVGQVPQLRDAGGHGRRQVQPSEPSRHLRPARRRLRPTAFRRVPTAARPLVRPSIGPGGRRWPRRAPRSCGGEGPPGRVDRAHQLVEGGAERADALVDQLVGDLVRWRCPAPRSLPAPRLRRRSRHPGCGPAGHGRAWPRSSRAAWCRPCPDR